MTISNVLLQGLFPVDPVKRSITGHSMGGHGAMVAHLKNPGMFSSVSAFSPIVNPSAVPWGEKVDDIPKHQISNLVTAGIHWLPWLC